MRAISAASSSLELHQPIVDLDGFERLDEYRLAGGAGRMHHAVDRAALRRAHRNHVAVVAPRDVVLAAFVSAGAQNALERLVQILAGSRDAFANAAQLRRRIVADFAIGQNGPANRRRQESEIAQRAGAFGEQRKLSRRSRESFAQRRR